MESRWRIQLLGGLRVERAGEVVTHFRTRKTAELLAYLAYHRARCHPREVLIELFWPECDLDAGRHSLNVALSSLRQQLEARGSPGAATDGSLIQSDRHAAGLNPAAFTTDVHELEQALKAARAAGAAERVPLLAAAVDLYGGELLPGCYEDWIVPEQQRLDELYFQALHQLIADLEQAGDPATALQYALRATGVNRLREEAHREVIRLYAASGQPGAALRQYRELERLLAEELDTTPGAATQALAREIERGGVGSVGRMGSVGSTGRSSPPGTSHTSHPSQTVLELEPVGGAVPIGSRFYVERATDAEFLAAIARRDSIVLVKGARQVGKTSLLARGLQQARAGATGQPGSGSRAATVALTHFQVFNAAQLETVDRFLLALAENLAEQLDLEDLPGNDWDPRRGPNASFRRYLRRQVLPWVAKSGGVEEWTSGRDEADPSSRSSSTLPLVHSSTPVLVWALDEIDRLFACPFATEVFGLFRSWYDERAFEPEGPWAQLTLAIAYSTEAHLFITDVNQSPFNVGTRLALEDFTPEQVADLNDRHGAPLHGEEERDAFCQLLGGHPYLVRRGLHEMAAHGTPLATLEARAAGDDWIFGEHLRRITVLLARDPALAGALQSVLAGGPCPTLENFYRLRSAGVLLGDAPVDARPRCRLYATYLGQRL